MRVIDFGVEAPKARARMADRKVREDTRNLMRMMMWSTMMPMALGLMWAGTLMAGMADGLHHAMENVE